MKKISSLIIALVMMCTFLPMSAFAASNPVITLTPSATDLSVGDEFTVTAELSNNPGFDTFEIALTWNTDIVDFTGFVTDGSNLAGGSIISTAIINNITSKITYASETKNTNNGVIFVANFKAKAAGNAGIAIDNNKLLMVEVVDGSNQIDLTSSVVKAEDAMAGVVVLEPIVGYAVGFTPAEQTKAIDETAEVKLNIYSDSETTYNAVDITFTYTGAELATTSIEGYTLTDTNGTVRLKGYGADKTVETDGFTFNFILKSADGAEITLGEAKVDKSANAAIQDAPTAEYKTKTAKINFAGHEVSLPEGFTGALIVENGADYTFEATDKNYNYTFTVTENGVAKDVIDNGDGTYTITNVKGALDIKVATKTGKQYTVTVDESVKADVTYEETATYGTDYIFTLNPEEFFVYGQPTITIGGNAYTEYIANEYEYTIKGEDITGDITISFTKTALEDIEVIFEGNAAGDAEGETTVKEGYDYTFTVEMAEGYTYTMSAKMGEEEATIRENDDGTYTVEDVTATLVITINKTADFTVGVKEYVKVGEEKAMYIVTAAFDVESDKAFKYGEALMYWSEEYKAYAYLVISDTELTAETAREQITVVTKSEAVVPETVNYTGDVNGTNVIDINDAQFIYDMYNAVYEDFDEGASIYRFLCADVNKDKMIDTNDAAAVVDLIP